MSNNQVRGPSSALSSFLRERGIRAPQNAYRRRRTNDAPITEERNVESSINEVTAAGPSDQEIPLQDSQSEQTPAPESSRTTVAESSKPTKPKATASKKPTKRKKKDDDESQSDTGAFATKKVAPRSNHSKRKRTGKENEALVKFCSRCLRRYLPQEDETICHACLSIKKVPGSAGGMKRKGKKMVVNADGERVSILSLKDLCIKLVADLIENVEQFGDISENTQQSIAKIISKHRQLNNNTVQLFLGPHETHLSLHDCTLILASGFSMISYMCPNLIALELGMCGRITDVQLKDIAEGCTQLKELALHGPFLCTDAGFSRLADLPLSSLTLSNASKMTSKSLEALASKCPNLEKLCLQYCASIGTGIDCITQFSQLKRLDLSYLGSISNEDICLILQKVGAGLEELDLNGYPELSDSTLELISDACPRLYGLSLADASSLTSAGFSAFLSKAKIHLKRVSLFRIVHLEDATLNALINHHGSSLQDININGLDELTVHSLAALANGTPRLKTLDVSWIRNIDDEIFEDIIKHCPELKTIKVYGCNRLTDVTMRRVWKNGQKVNVNIQGNEFD